MNNELNQKLLQVSAAMMELCTAITTLQKAMVTLFASLPDIVEDSTTDTQIEGNEPNTVGITTPQDVVKAISKAGNAEYQKRKSATNYRKALESIPETKRHALDNGEFSQ